MKINLFRSDDCEPEILADVFNLLSRHPGPMQFMMKPETTSFDDFTVSPEDPFRMACYSMEERSSKENFRERFFSRKTLEWKRIFNECKQLRKQHDIGESEFVILLTSHNNNLNWFSAGNPLGPRDHFVHTEDWDYFLGSDRRFPIAYQIASGVLKKFAFKDYEDLGSHWHHEPIGCMLDFCQDKKEVSLKVRTGDICPDCLRLFDERQVPTALIEQVFAIFDDIREFVLFKNRYKISKRIPVLHIQGSGKDFIIPELGKLSIHLSPLEKALYLFFLNHREGVMISHLSDHQEEIRNIYRNISNAGDNEFINERISELVDPRSNSCSEKISKIKRKFIRAVGEELATSFIISGANGRPKKIAVDRDLLVFEE